MMPKQTNHGLAFHLMVASDFPLFPLYWLKHFTQQKATYMEITIYRLHTISYTYSISVWQKVPNNVVKGDAL